MTETLLDYISIAYNQTKLTDKWANGALGEIVDIKGDGNYRFVDYTTYDNGELKKVHLSEDDEMTCPIVATGFVGYWLHNRDKAVRTVFEDYFAYKCTQYEREHDFDDDAWERDLKKEFITRKHISAERKLMKESEAIFAYLTESDVKRITSLSNNYLKFARKKKKELYPPNYPQNKVIEETFFAPYRLGGAAYECIDWMRTEYNLPYMKPLHDDKTEKDCLQGRWKEWHEVESRQWIKDEYDDFDETVLTYRNGGMMDEINENLKACPTHEDRIRYVISLLQPFKEFADAFYPKARIDSYERSNKELEKDRKSWEEVEDDAVDSRTGEPLNKKEQIEACDSMMQRHKEEIEYWKVVQDRFYWFAQHGLTKEFTEDEDQEMCKILGTWWHLMIFFARQLAALALSYGIKLPDVQEQCEVYLMWHYMLTDYVDDHYITTHEHAKRLLAEIGSKKEPKADRKVEELPSEPKSEEVVKSDFDYMKEYEDNPNLDHYLSEDHWNWQVNSVLYKNLLVFHDGQELGAFLNPSMGENYKSPVNDYTPLYGHLFNEAYRICNDVLCCDVPETKVARFAHEAAVWKFRNMTDEEGKPLKLVPNVIDLIESYHILGMVNVILYLANCDERKVDDFLLALSVYKDEGLYFCLYTHSFGSYNEIYQAFICATLKDGTNLRPDYDMKAKHNHMYTKFPWYKDFSDELDKRIAVGEAQKQKGQSERAKPKDNPKKQGCKHKTKPAEAKKPKTLKYYIHGNNGLLQKQRRRVDILFQKFEEWKWIKNTSAQDFDYFFEGEPRHCNITWDANSTILTILLQELLKQPYIQKQTGCATKSLVKEQFGLTANYDKENRIDKIAEERIQLAIYILNINNLLPERNRGNSQEEDTTDEALKAICSGLRVTKGI